MVQTVATMISLMTALAALLVIAATLAEEWQLLRHAIAPAPSSALPVLPDRVRMMPSPRRARIVRITPENSPSRAVA